MKRIIADCRKVLFAQLLRKLFQEFPCLILAKRAERCSSLPVQFEFARSNRCRGNCTRNLLPTGFLNEPDGENTSNRWGFHRADRPLSNLLAREVFSKKPLAGMGSNYGLYSFSSTLEPSGPAIEISRTAVRQGCSCVGLQTAKNSFERDGEQLRIRRAGRVRHTWF